MKTVNNNVFLDHHRSSINDNNICTTEMLLAVVALLPPKNNIEVYLIFLPNGLRSEEDFCALFW